jgi:ElaA protein
VKKVVIKSFYELDLDELYGILKLRQEVFVVEQDCPYIDTDGHDQAGHHVMIFEDDNLVAYSRILPKGSTYKGYASIGRVISAQSHRGKGLGREVMQVSLMIAKELWPEEEIKISAQVYALPFYRSLGFKEVGEEYLEDGIPHMGMIYHP